MPTQKELDCTYMQVALMHSQLSKAKRAKVGACIVTPQSVLLAGYNGQPKGLDNNCEYFNEDNQLVTLPSTIHAETNAVLKAAREGVSTLGATMYVSLSPCVQCSAMLVNAGISRLVYLMEYRDSKGIELLEKAGIKVERFKNKI